MTMTPVFTWQKLRLIAYWMVKLRLWKVSVQMRCQCVFPRRGTGWLWKWLRSHQVPDHRKHAPCCPANRWSGMAYVIAPCNCGASQ